MLDIIEHMGVAIVLSIIKNPAKLQAATTIMKGLADAIYEGLGLTPPTAPPAA
jgi:hypothetical protein